MSDEALCSCGEWTVGVGAVYFGGLWHKAERCLPVHRGVSW